jgi:nitrate reductase NapE component
MERKYLTSGFIFLVCFLSFFFLPIVAVYTNSFIPGIVTNYMFFWPQLSLPYDSLVLREAYKSNLVFSSFIATSLNIVQWVVITVFFSATASNMRTKKNQIGLSFIILILFPIILSVLVNVFGYTIELDGL